MIRKKLLVLVACIILLTTALFSCTSNETTKSGQVDVSIGLLVPLTGGAASYGQNSQRGVELALKEFAASHPNIKIKLYTEDSRGEASHGLRAAQKLVQVNNVKAIIGCVTSGVTLAVAPLMNEQKIAIISTGGSAPSISEAGEFVFRTWPSDTFEAQAMAGMLKDKNIKTLAILRVNNDYGVALENALRSHLAKDIKVLIVENFDQGSRDMRSQLLKIKESKADALYFIGFPEAAVVFGRFYATVGLSMPIFATTAFEDAQIPQKTGSALDGTIYAKPVAESSVTAAFKEKYKKEYGMEMGVTSDTAYDAATVLLNAIARIIEERHEATGVAIQQYLYTVRDFQGASGTFTFDSKGDVVKLIGFFILRKGKYEVYKN
jgi:branched-chain amino acid transport system substrate-binding protein